MFKQFKYLYHTRDVCHALQYMIVYNSLSTPQCDYCAHVKFHCKKMCSIDVFLDEFTSK